MTMIRSVAALAVAGLLGLAAPAGAASCDNVQVPDGARAGDAGLVLNGLGVRKATFLKVHVYVAALYLPAKSTSGDAILQSNAPWRLSLHFVRSVSAEEIRGAFTEGFAKAGGAHQALIADLNGRMTDFASGHVLGFIHEPGKGVTLDVNGTAYPAIGTADFARAFLRVFIGAEPPNPELKTGLLGGTCG